MKIDITPLKYFLKRREVALLLQGTPWGFFWKEEEDWPGVVQFKDRILFNLQEYSHYAIWVKEDNTIHLWFGQRDEFFQYRDGKLTLGKYQAPNRRRLLYKAEVFAASLDDKLEGFALLPIPINWREWCPCGIWPKQIVEVAREDVMDLVRETRITHTIVHALSDKLIGWIPEDEILRSIKLSEFDLSLLKNTKKNQFEYFVKTIVECNYQKIITNLLV